MAGSGFGIGAGTAGSASTTSAAGMTSSGKITGDASATAAMGGRSANGAGFMSTIPAIGTGDASGAAGTALRSDLHCSQNSAPSSL